MNLEPLSKKDLIQRIHELEKEVDALRENQRNVKSLLALLTHDLKGFFSSIPWLENIINSGALPLETILQLLPELKENAERNLKLIDDTLLGAIFEIENREDNLQHFDLGEVIDETVSDFTKFIEEKHLTIERKGNLWVRSNRMIVKSIVKKLLDNAIKFSYPGNSIKIKVGVSEGKAILSIQDFGIGMDIKTLENLFVFPRSPHLGTREERGAGLGLILVEEAVRLLDGELIVESELERGTTVKIRLNTAVPAPTL